MPSVGDRWTRSGLLLASDDGTTAERLVRRSSDPCSLTPRATENAVSVKWSAGFAAATTWLATVPGSRYLVLSRGAWPMASATSSRV